ncbi:hypothetical protein [Solirubrobacter soli]|uniref:hypothetical protein n=1 Tax=Solirubrobacter soli TaxID=363832 RepID=UPI00040441CF|nr:hypothetical protein [Solirubrobacter soli]
MANFNFSNFSVGRDQFNVAGDLTLHSGSSPAEVVQAIHAAQAELDKESEIGDAEKAAIRQDLAEAEQLAHDPQANRDELKEKLGRAQGRLDALKGVAGSALAVGKAVAAIAAWAGLAL